MSTFVNQEMAPQNRIISPFYLLNSDTRYIESTNMHLELCLTMDLVAAAQLIKGLWHLFTATEESMHVQPEKNITIKGTKLKILNTNPFSDINISKELTIRKLPFSLSNEYILEFLQTYRDLLRKVASCLVRFDDNSVSPWNCDNCGKQSEISPPPPFKVTIIQFSSYNQVILKVKHGIHSSYIHNISDNMKFKYISVKIWYHKYNGSNSSNYDPRDNQYQIISVCLKDHQYILWKILV